MYMHMHTAFTIHVMAIMACAPHEMGLATMGRLRRTHDDGTEISEMMDDRIIHGHILT